ncbi:ABC transporter permease [Occallatibacter riparius]|uniref:ABC transporter permease n=1 Tax=Occallatibacter riparius TaxID=1002689 RepID=A0A9J7BMS6_9BACT|nr:ABC transporter permease [Occallatibacter riparius]UWZ83943.1 ABC transporter permease [Occallatibacter riparius]
MSWFPSFGFQRRKRELQEEIDAHLQMAIADRVERGETPEAARQAASREFGNVPLVQDVTREMWGRGWFEQLGRDVRYALRQLRKSPGFTITATVMLTVAICANSTVFSWIDGTMLRPIPGARDTGDLVSLQRGERNFSPVPPFSYLDYRDLREQNHSLSGMLAFHHDWTTLTGGAQPERAYIANVTANYFDVLGIKPVLGRFFLPEEETRPDAVPNVVLGYSVWKMRYAADPAIVGKSIEIARHPVTVIGVAPEGFVGAMPGLRDDLWITLDPLGTSAWRMTHRSGGAVWLNVIGRLRPGVSRDQAAQDLDTLMQHIVAAYPNDHLGENRISLDPMWRSPFGANGFMAATLPILLAFAAVVLLLTSANVATLTLVRFVSRRRELAIRQSLGANRMQLVRQMVLEGVMLSIVAGAGALALTTWTSKTFAWFFRASSGPTTLNGRMDHNVVIGIAVFSLLAGIFCGALPAWRSSHAPAIEVLKAESGSISGGSRNRRLLSALVVAQIALSLPLLLCSGLLLRTLRNLAGANPGFEQDHILTASVGLNIAGYSGDEEQLIRHKILDRVSVLPGVKVASFTDWIPMSLSHKGDDAYPEGYVPHPHESLEVYHAEVGPRYFESLRIPILEGREFTPDDGEKAPRVMIVDQTAARRYWPGQDPLGKKLMVWGRPFTVVGVAKNSIHMLMNESPEPMVYMSFFQAGYETIVQVKTEGNPADLAPAVENAIHTIDTRLPVFDVRPMRETTQLASSFAVIESTLAGMFALIGLVLAATGIYGVVAYRTQMRTHEIGVRMALGASRVDVLRLVLLQGLGLTGIGLALGLAFALALTRFIARLLYGIGANDPVTVVSVVMLLGAMSLLACYLPARRAMRRNPVSAIREL